VLQLDAKMRPFKVDYYVSAKATSPMASLYYKYNAQGDEISVSVNAKRIIMTKPIMPLFTHRRKSPQQPYTNTHMIHKGIGLTKKHTARAKWISGLRGQ